MTFLIISFIAGILTILAPCILPLLPVVLGGAVADAGNKRRPFIIIASLSVSVFVFTLLLKGSTALLSVSPSFWTYVSATILGVFGLTLVFPETWARIILKIPGHNKPDTWLSKNALGKSSVWTDILIGAALGPVFTTCSPTFFVILATVLPQSLAMGVIDLIAYIVGLALMLLLVSWIGQKLVNKLNWAADPKGWFRKILGLLFIILAILIALGLDKVIESNILNSGFFDVTTVEQHITEALQGRPPLPNQSNGALNSTTNSATTSSGTSDSSATTSDNGTGGNSGSGTSFLSSLFGGSNTPDERNEGPYIEIQDPSGFVNSPPFKLADFVGKKVILIDFIDYSCINCERTFPYLNEWWSKYQDQGLEIVAIHTPEFAFEKNINNVEAAAKQFGLQFPIVLDNDYATWNAYQNEYWPHKYLIDIHGNIVYDHIGEGDYDQTEAEIVKQLNIRDQFLGLPQTATIGTSSLPSDYTINAESPETYFGAMRNDSFGNGEPYTTGESVYSIPNNLTSDQFYLGGDWDIEQEYAQAVGSTTQVSYVFTADNMYMVAATADGSPVTAQVLIDGKSIPSTWEGADVKNGILTVSSSRLYSLYKNSTLGRHRIDIIFNKPGVQVYTFTFG